jgi:hypothetical protein
VAVGVAAVLLKKKKEEVAEATLPEETTNIGE